MKGGNGEVRWSEGIGGEGKGEQGSGRGEGMGEQGSGRGKGRGGGLTYMDKNDIQITLYRWYSHCVKHEGF